MFMLVSWFGLKIGRAVQQECRDRKSGSAGMPRPISYAVFCLKKKKFNLTIPLQQLNGLETLVIIMVANKYVFLQITRRRFMNECEAFKKVISRRNIRRRITIPLFFCNRNHLSLHSFPTRRSSDLGRAVQQEC